MQSASFFDSSDSKNEIHGDKLPSVDLFGLGTEHRSWLRALIWWYDLQILIHPCTLDIIWFKLLISSKFRVLRVELLSQYFKENFHLCHAQLRITMTNTTLNFKWFFLLSITFYETRIFFKSFLLGASFDEETLKAALPITFSSVCLEKSCGSVARKDCREIPLTNFLDLPLIATISKSNWDTRSLHLIWLEHNNSNTWWYFSDLRSMRMYNSCLWRNINVFVVYREHQVVHNHNSGSLFHADS